MKRATAFGLAVVAAWAFTSAVAPVTHGGDESKLFGPAYFATSITKDGEARELVEDTRLRVKFNRDEERDAVTWSAGCNYFGARIVLADAHIDTRQISGTQIGCRRALARQDDWIARFFASDPAYSTEGRRLTLSNERIVIE
ncbi:MAG: META domain-containing protein, partial [Actinomycetota bacterium]|nr:META domain-containing protein [Actinomycetota bacterium]